MYAIITIADAKLTNSYQTTKKKALFFVLNLLLDKKNNPHRPESPRELSTLINLKKATKLLQISSLLIEIILIGSNRELVASRLVAYHDSVWMHLQHRSSPHV